MADFGWFDTTSLGLIGQGSFKHPQVRIVLQHTYSSGSCCENDAANNVAVICIVFHPFLHAKK